MGLTGTDADPLGLEAGVTHTAGWGRDGNARAEGDAEDIAVGHEFACYFSKYTTPSSPISKLSACAPVFE